MTKWIESTKDVSYNRRETFTYDQSKKKNLDWSAYGQSLLTFVIVQFNMPCWKGVSKLYIESTDDDIFEFTFPNEDWEKVKNVIRHNYKSPHFVTILCEWAGKKGYDF